MKPSVTAAEDDGRMRQRLGVEREASCLTEAGETAGVAVMALCVYVCVCGTRVDTE